MLMGTEAFLVALIEHPEWMAEAILNTPAPGEQPNGPGHLEMYKLVQSAGKIVHIEFTTGPNLHGGREPSLYRRE